MPSLLISVRFHDGRYHGSGAWPPSPARLFQALVAAAARGERLGDDALESLRWLEALAPPVVAAPVVYTGQGIKNFVPNNDLDAIGGDPARIGEIRTAKIVRPRYFDAAVPLLYAWTFAQGADAERHARTMCRIADNLHQLGRGVDMAWAIGEVIEESEAEARIRGHGGVIRRPGKSGDGTMLPCPHAGSLASLMRRFAAMRGRFKTVGQGRRTSLLFAQAPKPDFAQIPYDSPPTFLLFDIRSTDADAFASQPFARIVSLAEKMRDLASERLKKSAWRRDYPKREDCIEKVFVGRASTEADKAQRIRITPLPSIGHAQTARAIRRVLVTMPPDCPVAVGDIAWTFSGLMLDFDPETGEIPSGGAMLVTAPDRTMLDHYGIESERRWRLWRTVTPATLPERAARRRIDPARIREEAKGGAERQREEEKAACAVRDALRHAGVDASVQAIRVQREPFEARGQRAEAFAPGTRFAKERLWHAEIAFAESVRGPILIGDGRYLGLGLMAPLRRSEGVFAFAIEDGLAEKPDHNGLARALRRAVMARVQAQMGPRAILPVFFTGHETDGASAQAGGHAHLAFAFDALRRRLIVLAPHILERRGASPSEHRSLSVLEQALEDFCELRAGAAGKLALVASPVDMLVDPLFARSSIWESLTPYRATRHAKMNDAAAALEADLLVECRRAGFPRPQIEIMKTFARPGLGLFGHAKLTFRSAVEGPILLGRDRHFGGGLFGASLG